MDKDEDRDKDKDNIIRLSERSQGAGIELHAIRLKLLRRIG